MDINFLIKIIGIGLIVCVAYQILVKTGHDEQALLVTMAGTIMVMLMLMQEIADLLSTIKTLFGI